MKQEIIDKIKSILSENELFAGKPVDEEIIKNAEKELNVNFDKDYIQFLSLFGGSFTGFPVYGFNNCDMLSEETVVDLSNDFRDNYLNDNRCDLIQESYVISISGNGDPVFISPDNKVWIYYHDNDETEELNKSFEELIEKNLLN
ncbi:SMI1/KNR4 family protein [Flavobacterium columnare]|uniref:SMI1/KNR4 family protein n=1 Tax=Flavobacterium columnare TaxID=996 RepID=A0AA94F0G0_9FLAO|nr:SMI1/KNR4 family protein [Flavobacterium columnare]MCH4829560.1 SMI1/KNR4 family protein [Flavobacterium columnare]MCH4831443.1 SMI1/KNR4 family protein [Flavobacterium columnare]